MSRTHDITISGFDLDRLEAKIDEEAALADRLAGALNKAIEIIPDDAYVAERIEVRRWEKALTAWKEARSES